MGAAGAAGDRFASAVTALLAVFVVAVLSGVVLVRRGNLAWDDADYLRRGLSNARFAEAGGPLLVVPRAIDRLLSEQPKPPWFVAWIELGVHAIGRRSIDVFSRVLHDRALFAFDARGDLDRAMAARPVGWLSRARLPGCLTTFTRIR